MIPLAVDPILWLTSAVETLQATIHSPALWVAVGQIIAVDIVLAGDNAIVIALACRMLGPRQRFLGMVLGAGVAVLMRVVFTLLVSQALDYPGIKILGALALLWIAVKLVVPEVEDDGADKVKAADTLWRAVWIIAIADIVMSLDNVIAIAALAETASIKIDAAHALTIRSMLIVFGLIVSIPLVVAGSAMLMALLDRVPILVWAGAGLLGWVAGDILIKDSLLRSVLSAEDIAFWHYPAAAFGAAIVLGLGYFILRRRQARADESV